MINQQFLAFAFALAPLTLMGSAVLATRTLHLSTSARWRVFLNLSFAALVFSGLAAVFAGGQTMHQGAVATTSIGLILAVLVQLLGLVIGRFSARYLQGEPGQQRYITSLALVLTTVHLLLLANHWLVLITAWALVGVALQRLLCFYPDRPFALLAAHKKRLADRIADLLLIAAAGLAWFEVGSGSLSALWAHIAQQGMSMQLQLCALFLVLAVVLRTALLPVHGWLIQVMEAPTPVSALLHAGVINLGGFVLIRFAPLLEQAALARTLLLAFGLITAVLAGMVMLTRISIKVRLAWSTLAQMGFMLLECALGLYTLAALHLIGHSLYKAHAFLSSSSVVRDTRIHTLVEPAPVRPISLFYAPAMSIGMVLMLTTITGSAAWPWWWSVLMGLAWAPMLWLPSSAVGAKQTGQQILFGLLIAAGLTSTALLGHAVPFGVQDSPSDALGVLATLGMFTLYVCLVMLQVRPELLSGWRRWSYAGFYVDEAYTRIALRLWPARWTPESAKTGSKTR